MVPEGYMAEDDLFFRHAPCNKWKNLIAITMLIIIFILVAWILAILFNQGFKKTDSTEQEFIF